MIHDSDDPLRFLVSPNLEKGRIALVKGGRIVWIGPLGAPIEDADFDKIALSEEDLSALVKFVRALGSPLP